MRASNKWPRWLYVVEVVFLFLCTNQAVAEITDYYVTDVSSRSFTVVFSSTEVVVAPDIRVFQDSTGQNVISTQFDILSSALQHLNGLAVIRVHSLDSSTPYYFDISIDMGTAIYHPSQDIPLVTTFSVAPVSVGAQLALSSNDLIKLDVYKPEQIASLAGAIVLLSVPSVSIYPVSARIDVDNFAYVDANNLLSNESSTLLLEEGRNIEIKVLRGLLCNGTVDHLQVFYRKHGADSQEGSQVNLAQRCNSVDTVCDDQINVLDVQFVLNSINKTASDCGFTSELDVVEDSQINVLDVQQILNSF